MAVGSLIPVEEYLATVHEVECEYADGELIERNRGESDHSGVQMALAALLCNQRHILGIHVFPELRVQLSANRFRVPDIAATVRRIHGRILREPPLLWIEILSPEHRMSRMEAKVSEILAFGVPHIWVLDPRFNKAWFCTNQGRRDAVGFLEIPNPNIVVKLADVFDSLDDEIER